MLQKIDIEIIKKFNIENDTLFDNLFTKVNLYPKLIKHEILFLNL